MRMSATRETCSLTIIRFVDLPPVPLELDEWLADLHKGLSH